MRGIIRGPPRGRTRYPITIRMMRLESPIAARAIKRTSGDMGEKAECRSQESGVRSQESGVRSQEWDTATILISSLNLCILLRGFSSGEFRNLFNNGRPSLGLADTPIRRHRIRFGCGYAALCLCGEFSFLPASLRALFLIEPAGCGRVFNAIKAELNLISRGSCD
jgi:hypothetical protein